MFLSRRSTGTIVDPSSNNGLRRPDVSHCAAIAIALAAPATHATVGTRIHVTRNHSLNQLAISSRTRPLVTHRAIFHVTRSINVGESTVVQAELQRSCPFHIGTKRHELPRRVN